MNYADIIFTGASFYTGEGNDDIRYLAVKDNKISHIGKTDDYSKFCNDDTKIVKLNKNQLVMPGFHDSHVHLLMAGMYQKFVNLGSAASEEEAAERVREFAENLPDEKWILGFGWHQNFWGREDPPTAKSLDAVLPNRPVFLIDQEAHAAWANSAALKIAGITKDTQDPSYGRLERYENGNPTGYLDEAALGLVGKYAFDFSYESEKEMIEHCMDVAVSYGVTSVQDMVPYFGCNLGKPETFSQMDKDGELKVRIFAALDLLEGVEPMKEAAAAYNGNMYQICQLKQFLDGVPSSYTAMVYDGYADDPGNHGKPCVDIEQIKKNVAEAHRQGISVRLHCCGDGAARTALDCYEAAVEQYGFTDTRHGIEHIEIVQQDDIKRLAELKVLVSMQPEAIAMTKRFKDNVYPSRYSSEQLKYSWAYRTYLDNGVTLLLNTDCPCNQLDPFIELYRAMTRIHDDGEPKGGWNPQEKISIQEAIRGYTQAGAYAVKKDDVLGTLTAGKLADIVVIDTNLIEAEPDEVRNAKVLMTVVDGKVVYDCM